MAKKACEIKIISNDSAKIYTTDARNLVKHMPQHDMIFLNGSVVVSSVLE